MRGRFASFLLVACLPLLVAACAPPPPPVVLSLSGEDPIVFQHAQLEFLGGRDEPVGAKVLAQEDLGRDDGLILRLVLFGESGIRTSGLAGKTFRSETELGEPGSARLELIWTPEPVDSGDPGAFRLITPMQAVAWDLEVHVRAAAPGILHATGTCRVLMEGRQVEVEFTVEHR